MLNFRRVFCLLALLLSAGSAFAAAVRVGDPDSKPDAAKFDENYIDMKEWAEAGVRGGIPKRESLKIVKTLKAGDDIQAAIDDAGKSGGVVLLSPGVYPIKKCLQLRNGVVLRGQNKDGVVLENTMRASRLTDADFTVRFPAIKHAGLEDLTMRHAEVAKIGLAAYAERVAGPKNDV